MNDPLDNIDYLISTGRAERCLNGLAYVRPESWATQEVTHGRGARFRGGDLKHVQAWTTKAQARAGAQAIGWPASAVSKIHTRLFGSAWALMDGRLGCLSRVSYEALLESRNRSNAVPGPG